MAKAGRKVAAIAAAMVLGTSAAAGASDARQTIVLKVDNQCRVPDSILQRAQDAATEIYLAAGIRLVWLPFDGSAPVDAADALHLQVRLTSRENQLLAGTKLSPYVVGIAPPNTRTAYVFCRRVEAQARLAGIRMIDEPLGRALAHEIGHQVLPGMGHSETGIMRAKLDFLSLQHPAFTQEEGESIRAHLMAAR